MAKLGDAYRSPYCNRITSLYEPLLERDQMIICYLLAPIGSIGSMMYKSESGTETIKINFESFHPSQFVASNGVDAFVDVLNFEEKKKGTKNHHRTGCSCQYAVKKIDTVDLIFIPVLLSDHFWCLCFHLKNGEIELIDNSRFKESFSKRYRGRPEMLSSSSIPERQDTTKRMDNKLGRTSIIRKEMDWRTLQNGVYCVFTMRHMETYKGKSPWNPRFVNEDKKTIQDSQLRFLRYRYLSKSVLSDYNLIRKEVYDKAKEFAKTARPVDVLNNLDNKVRDRLDQFFKLEKVKKNATS
ncbi:hypothetical protein Hanom_Chr00s022523g01761741 [Helianthus anomalus]